MSRSILVKNGGYVWEKKLKKLSGEINAEDGVPYVMTSTTKDIYLITKTYATATMELGVFMTPDNNFLVLGPDGLFKMNQAGETMWEGEWKWKPKEINYKPTMTKKGLLYQYKKSMLYISLEDGSMIWKSKEKAAKDVDVFFNEALDRVFILNKKGVDVYKL